MSRIFTSAFTRLALYGAPGPRYGNFNLRDPGVGSGTVGLEWETPRNRLDYTLGVNRPHFVMAAHRLHAILGPGLCHAALPVNRIHLSVSDEDN